MSCDFKGNQVIRESVKGVRGWIKSSHHGSDLFPFNLPGPFLFLFYFILLEFEINQILSFLPFMSHSIPLILFLFFPLFVSATQWLQYPDSGIATLTHYTLPENDIASCGCTAESTHHPTAALNQMAFGSTTAFGPACGRCFKLTLLNTFLSHPPFYPTVTKSLVVKVTDLCPLSTTGWCNGTVSGPNA
jgi:hypothetical protein